MLKNIKSSYFTEILFSYLIEKKKLKIVKYNKCFQEIMDISIINYMHFKGKYIIYKTNKEGKEYNYVNDLLYEGEYLNGERNGKGREYKAGDLIFEGSYLNGERNGKGREYNKQNKLIFESEYKRGLKCGKVKIYDYDDGNLIFDGEYLNDKELLGKTYDKAGNIKYEINKVNG